MCVISPHNSAGMVIIMWCQIIKFSPVPNDMSALCELKLFQVDRFARSYGIQKLLRRREILECVQNLVIQYRHFYLQLKGPPAQLSLVEKLYRKRERLF